MICYKYTCSLLSEKSISTFIKFWHPGSEPRAILISIGACGAYI